MRLVALALAGTLAACQAPPTGTSAEARSVEARIAEVERKGGTVRLAAFVAIDGVFNSELMAPYDVLHHTRFRDEADYVEPVVVSPDGGPVTTFEGLTVAAHYSFDAAPPADILVIPSADGSMSADLEDGAYLGYIARTAEAAEWVITVCDGAFPLAATGMLDGRVATTFPADRAALADRFPAVDVRDDVRLVVDGKYITSVGGAMSYEPAFWLVEHLWGPERVAGNAEGLVWPWDPAALPHLVVDRDSARLGAEAE
ncbi:DJ-1/PfpI family protein [Rubrivirga marina]|uniref:DJ-1/PfpI domain-containing protein n=1 Tax=Rubrivirga marina TaxID=1196024 RepID=A0A271IVS0_9BACT|nr:DJ-1/PfpI family protein [Rubrivirga marina]PAP75351.1 hypothetical protein BSZ37_02260 [Rubrivirga marina]